MHTRGTILKKFRYYNIFKYRFENMYNIIGLLKYRMLKLVIRMSKFFAALCSRFLHNYFKYKI